MNSFGRLFRVSLFGESRGECVGALLDGCPAGVKLAEGDFEPDMARRRAGALGTTPRLEPDRPHIASGTFNGRTTGAPILIMIRNEDACDGAGAKKPKMARPGHADLVAEGKFSGFQDWRGGGHFSGRLTAALVAAGVVAKKVVAPAAVEARLAEVSGCADFGDALKAAVASGDSVGGIVECEVSGLPVGLGEPFFDSVESLVSHAAFSIPGVKGVEFGAGFACARMTGAQMNELESAGAAGRRRKAARCDASGGANGGLTNGNVLVFRVAVRPPSTLSRPMNVIDLRTGRNAVATHDGRNDTCIALRAPVIVEAITAMVLADLLLLDQARARTFRED
jgi:chorismate synthase